MRQSARAQARKPAGVPLANIVISGGLVGRRDAAYAAEMEH
jgi:hypothetical protein